MKTIDILKKIVLSERRLTAMLVLALFIVSENPEITITDLSIELKVSTAAATGIIDSLELQGLLKRKKTSDDRRKILLVITNEGEELLESLSKHDISENNT